MSAESDSKVSPDDLNAEALAEAFMMTVDVICRNGAITLNELAAFAHRQAF